MFDLLIANGSICDGTGREVFQADIGIVGDRIESIGGNVPMRAKTVLDATGLSVCPGFIDVHSHSDFSALALGTSQSKVLQGVTTEVIGNCGLSAAPLMGPCKTHLQESYAYLKIPMEWEDLAGYARHVEESGVSVNLMALIGHGNLRASVLGYGDRQPNKQELGRMKDLLARMMDQGACGMSSGLIYPPGIFSRTDELIGLGDVLRDRGGLYATHMRSEGDMLLESIEESLRIGKECSIPVQISHLKTAGQQNWHKLHAALELIAQAQAEGVSVHVDRYPYTAASTDLDAMFPSWAFDGGNAAQIRRLQDPRQCQKIKEEVLRDHPQPEYWGRIQIASVRTDKNRQHEGKTVARLAQDWGMHPWDALVRLLLEEQLQVQANFFSLSEENLKEILALPYAMIGSDSSSRAAEGFLSAGKPHPRSYGTFPRVLQKFVREQPLMPFAEAVRKMTALPAQAFGIPDRGVIRDGMKADLVLLDPGAVADRATYENPHRYPAGIPWVLVNGKVVVQDGRHTQAKPGRLLRLV